MVDINTMTAKEVVLRLIDETPEPAGQVVDPYAPYYIDADIDVDVDSTRLRTLARYYGLELELNGLNGMPTLSGTLSSKERVKSFAQTVYGSVDMSVAPHESGQGSWVYFE